MPNRLAHENSLYLRQHAENPVDWYPWGPEALQKARSEDKPILVSIGYAACHWCHVMAHESFEDDYIAKLMNTHFVCIKVDREERPEIDRIYMDAVQMMNGQGGWPLNVFCLPDGRPFAGGTYFPPDESRGVNMVPWPQLLMRVADFYNRQRNDLVENANAIMGNLEASNSPHQATGDPLQPDELLQAAGTLLDSEDKQFGGFGAAPKFPPAMSLDFLLAVRATAAVDLHQRDLAAQLDDAVNRCLTAMAHGGLFDQIGGGFARYSVDRHWIIPHFEKMLYDNALLLDIYAKAHQRYPRDLYRKVVLETIQFLDRELAAPNGAYFASLDADTTGGEGRTYLWSPDEIQKILGQEEGAAFCEAYGITAEGNFEDSGLSNPVLLDSDPAARQRFAPARKQLLRHRLDHKPQPARDEKTLTAWNALLCRAFTSAALACEQPDFLHKALRIAHWIWNDQRDDQGRLLRVAYPNATGDSAASQASQPGNLDDYAYTAEAFLALAGLADWIEPGSSSLWIERAVSLFDTLQTHFADPAAMGYFYTAGDHPDLIHRKKEWFDNATPSAHSALLHAAAALEVITGEARYAKFIQQLRPAYPGIAAKAPMAVGYALAALTQHATGLAVIKIRPDVDLADLLHGLARKPCRPVWLLQSPAHQSLPAAYQLCVGNQCLPPQNDLASLLEVL